MGGCVRNALGGIVTGRSGRSYGETCETETARTPVLAPGYAHLAL